MMDTCDKLLQLARKLGADTPEGLILACVENLVSVEADGLRGRRLRRAIFEEIADIATEAAENL